MRVDVGVLLPIDCFTFGGHLFNLGFLTQVSNLFRGTCGSVVQPREKLSFIWSRLTSRGLFQKIEDLFTRFHHDFKFFGVRNLWPPYKSQTSELAELHFFLQNWKFFNFSRPLSREVVIVNEANVSTFPIIQSHGLVQGALWPTLFVIVGPLFQVPLC
jgi:hypothetical protein